MNKNIWKLGKEYTEQVSKLKNYTKGAFCNYLVIDHVVLFVCLSVCLLLGEIYCWPRFLYDSHCGPRSTIYAQAHKVITEPGVLVKLKKDFSVEPQTFVPRNPTNRNPTNRNPTNRNPTNRNPTNMTLCSLVLFQPSTASAEPGATLLGC